MFSRNAPIRPRKLPKWWGQRVSEAAPFRNGGLEWKSPCARRRNSPKLPPEDRAGTDPPSSACLLSQADPAWSIGTLALDVEDLGFGHPRTWRSWTDMLSAGCACGGVGLAMVFRSSIRATESRVKST